MPSNSNLSPDCVWQPGLRFELLCIIPLNQPALPRVQQVWQEQVLGHPMVQLVALGPDSPTVGSFAFDPVDDEGLDRVHPPEQLTVLDRRSPGADR